MPDEFYSTTQYPKIGKNQTYHSIYIRDLLATFFHENKDCYGYRRKLDILKKIGLYKLRKGCAQTYERRNFSCL